jgi:predicted metalloendopeptidase
VYDSLEFLPIEMRQRKARFLKETTGESNNITRWKECVDLTAEKLNVAVSALYIRKNIVPGTKNDTRVIFNSVFQKFKGVVSKVEWMDEDTRTEALVKLDRLLLFNGFPDEHLNDEALTRFYSDLVLDDKEFFKSVFKCDHHLFRKQILKYRKVVDKENWESHSNSLPVIVYYDFDENSLGEDAYFLKLFYFICAFQLHQPLCFQFHFTTENGQIIWILVH